MLPESDAFAMLVGRTGDPADPDQRLELQFRRFEHRVFNGFSLPRVGDVHFAVLGLDDGGVRILAWCALEGEDGFPSFAIIGNGNVEHVAVGWEDDASCGVVVYDELATVLERDGVGAADARVGDLNKNLIGANNRYGHFTDSVSLWLTSIAN